MGYGENNPKAMAEAFHAICTQPVADGGVVFDVDALEAAPIREEIEYGGVRVRTTATIAGARIPIQVDIGFGDATTPGSVDIEYPSLLDAPAPHLRAYPVATVVAEKFEAMVTLGMANSRLKDFYDLWLIAETFELERSALTDAVQQTFTRRRTNLPKERPTGLSKAYAEVWDRQWRAFLGRERMAAAPLELAVVIADLAQFLLPLTEFAEGNWRWEPRKGWALLKMGQEE
ncbi:nucleotidyl transferase AbiEii/AbiGii toxin family protein [Rhizobium sp. LC145]|uniref:nucleotidyl transferase AbiEii/AbiGii toxin family protein n=1 Tax=Rhizobium sp. LC145 TaxID=1120688 RepID=UPI001FDA05A1|nr:nucleotidyl transferase AbiEii/AbiGii toxin family protein [Rhizobium sp. LC145]